MVIGKIYQNAKDALKTIGITYLVIGGMYGFAAHSTGITTGHVSSDIALDKDQLHAIVWRKLVGPTLEDVILASLEID